MVKKVDVVSMWGLEVVGESIIGGFFEAFCGLLLGFYKGGKLGGSEGQVFGWEIIVISV